FNEIDIDHLTADEMMDFLNHFQDGCNEISQLFSKTYYLIDPASEQAGSQTQTQSQSMSTKGITTMKYKVDNTNILKYETIVDQSMNSIRLKPKTDETQRLLSYRADITPATLTKEHIDIWGNDVETFF